MAVRKQTEGKTGRSGEQPIEMYSEPRITEFDKAETELKRHLTKKKVK